MALNILWIAFFVAAFLCGLAHWLIGGDSEVFPRMLEATFDSAKSAFEIALFLTGSLCLWLGIMRIGEKAGLVDLLARLVRPLFRRLFPEVPAEHPAMGNMLMNIAANMLGLDNAATPLGLKAMKELQSLNPEPETASNAQIMFLVLNASGLTIVPVSIMVYRAELGAANPADIFLPVLLATSASTMAGLVAVALFQRIRLWDPVVLLWLGSAAAIVLALIWQMSTMPKDDIATLSRTGSSVFLFVLITGFIAMAAVRRINVYETFIEGAKGGFAIAVEIIPYLVAMLVAIAVFRASGAMDLIIDGIRAVLTPLGVDTRWVHGLPTALMKPLSGSGARGLMVDAMKTHGADSFVGRLVCILQGSTDTTFYILAVYFGSVGLRKTRHAVACGLIADIAGITAAFLLAYMFFG